MHASVRARPAGPSAASDLSSDSAVVDEEDAPTERDPEFFLHSAKYLVWLGEVGERETTTALYVYKIVSQDETNFKAYALHASKGCSTKDCIR